MRGAQRIQVIALLALSGALAGALTGFAAGALPIPMLGRAAIGVAVVAALLDVARVPTLSVRRQVPQYWGRIFEPRTVAVLYGARLGVGPLTLLPTWLWWAALVVGAARGPWAGAATGAMFALVRTATMWTAGTRARSFDRIDQRLRLGIAVTLVMVALAACSSDHGRASATSIRRAPHTTTTTTPEDTTLAELLLPDALPGFHRADAALGAGTLDLAAAASAEVDSQAERALLETRGFVRGASRAWLGPHDDVVYVTAYELGSAAQADAYLVDGAETLAARSGQRFDVAEIPGAFGFTTREQQEGGDFVTHNVAFTRAAHWFLVTVGSTAGTRSPAEAIRLAAAQAAAAP